MVLCASHEEPAHLFWRRRYVRDELCAKPGGMLHAPVAVLNTLPDAPVWFVRCVGASRLLLEASPVRVLSSPEEPAHDLGRFG